MISVIKEIFIYSIYGCIL